LATAASTTFCITGVMSAPIPSPRIKGIIGLSGTTSFPFESISIALPCAGTTTLLLNIVYSKKFKIKLL